MLGRVIRDITRRIDRPNETRGHVHAATLACSPGQGSAPAPAWHRGSTRCDAPEVEYIGKGKAHEPYEFGVKVSVATPLNHCRGRPVSGRIVKALPGNPYDGHTLAAFLPDIESTIGTGLEQIVTDAGYKGQQRTEAPALQGLRSRSEARAHCCRQTRDPQALRPWSPRSVRLKNGHRIGRNHLAGRADDAANVVLAAMGYNFRLSSSRCARSLAAHSARRPRSAERTRAGPS